MSKKQMEILIVRFSSLGDVILTLPVITALRERFVDARISFISKAGYSEIVSCHPGLDRVIVEDEKRDKGAFKVFKLKKKLKPHYDLVVDLHASLKSRLVTRLVSADQVLTYNKGAISRRLLVKPGIRLGNFPHVVDRYLGALESLNIHASLRQPRMNLPKEALEEADEFLRRYEISPDKPIIGMSPMAVWPSKRWPAAYFVELGKMLTDSHEAAVMLFGSSEEWEPLESIGLQIGERAVNAAGLPSLILTAALIGKTRVFVCNDSGPMHLAGAVGVPVVTFFGPTVKEFGFWPRADADIILERDLACRPCSLHGSNKCRLKTFECLTGITPAEAYNAVVSRLD